MNFLLPNMFLQSNELLASECFYKVMNLLLPLIPIPTVVSEQPPLWFVVDTRNMAASALFKVSQWTQV
jgi:hypothetical protein